MDGNTLHDLRSALLRVASISPKNFLTSIGVLLACISSMYLNTGTYLLLHNATAWKWFLVALSVALIMASDKIKVATRNTNELPITSNDTTPPISDIIYTFIFVISGLLAQFCLLYILNPPLAWLRLCSPLFFLLPEISHTSYKKVVQWLAGIFTRAFNKLRQIFLPPQQAEPARPEAYNDKPATTGDSCTVKCEK